MDIRSYLETAPRGAAAAVARRVGVHPVMVSQWAGRVKTVPVERCVAIESATDGAVTRRDLRPDDWWRIWPELVTEEHPAPATEADHAA